MIMSKIKKLDLINVRIFSNRLFFTAVIVNSIIYLTYNFISNDVEPSIRIYGKVQLIIAIFTITMMIITERVHNKFFRQFLSYIFRLALSALLLIQLIPAILWIMFNGQVVAEMPLDNGVMGSWIYGAYHILIIIWGIFNAYPYR